MIGRFAAWQEVYSIDESFIGLRGTTEDLANVGHQIKDAVLRHVGLPVCVGFAPSKTLAKLATYGAKHSPGFRGVCHWDGFTPEHQTRIMDNLPATELWGVAGRTEKRLNLLDIHTVRELRDADPALIRKKFSVVLQRTVFELRGIDCIPLEGARASKQQLIYSRMFSAPIRTVPEMEQVLSVYAQKVSYRLRKQGSVAATMQVSAGTSPYSEVGPRSFPSASIAFSVPTDDPITFSKAAVEALSPHLDPGARYVRAGVILTGITPKASHSYLEPFVPVFERKNLGQVLDTVTRRHGSGAIGLGLAGVKTGPVWQMRREQLSPRATTHWDELAVAYAK